jgi:hypothetical protein
MLNISTAQVFRSLRNESQANYLLSAHPEAAKLERLHDRAVSNITARKHIELFDMNYYLGVADPDLVDAIPYDPTHYPTLLELPRSAVALILPRMTPGTFHIPDADCYDGLWFDTAFYRDVLICCDPFCQTFWAVGFYYDYCSASGEYQEFPDTMCRTLPEVKRLIDAFIALEKLP